MVEGLGNRSDLKVRDNGLERINGIESRNSNNGAQRAQNADRYKQRGKTCRGIPPALAQLHAEPVNGPAYDRYDESHQRRDKKWLNNDAESGHQKQQQHKKGNS